MKAISAKPTRAGRRAYEQRREVDEHVECGSTESGARRDSRSAAAAAAERSVRLDFHFHRTPL